MEVGMAVHGYDRIMGQTELLTLEVVEGVRHIQIPMVEVEEVE